MNVWSNLAQETQFWEFIDGFNLAQVQIINFGLIQFSAILGMKPISCSSQFILWQQKAVKNNFKKKELFHKWFTLVFVRLFVAALAIVYQESHFWRTEGQEFLHLCVNKNFSCLNHCNAWSNLMQEIQFLKFMVGSSLTHAHLHYLFCMHFIPINTVNK